MTEKVPADQIEKIVGVKRDPVRHIGRAVSSEKKVYVLHSEACLSFYENVQKDCRYAVALENGIREKDWKGFEDRPVVLSTVGFLRVYPHPSERPYPEEE